MSSRIFAVPLEKILLVFNKDVFIANTAYSRPQEEAEENIKTGLKKITDFDFATYEKSFGAVYIGFTHGAIVSLYITCDFPYSKRGNSLTDEAVLQLEEYFKGTRKIFDIPIAPPGTDFQKKIWKEITNIPYGETKSYGHIAALAGYPFAARAAGGACRKNPIQIIIPCHRVIGARGGLAGRADGLEMNQRLLKFESQHIY